jgi:phosphoglycerol transferase
MAQTSGLTQASGFGGVPPAAGSPSAESEVVVALLLAAIVLIAALTFRNAGLNVVVLSDEWIYSTSSRLQPFAAAARPSYLFYALYRATSYCGDGFLDCARLLDAVCLALALPFLYLAARRYLAPRIAAFVAVLSVFGPAHSYAAYFMPESMYFLGFWVFAWFVLTRAHLHPAAFGAGAGALLAALALVKAHAVFLVPALVAYVAALPALRIAGSSWRWSVAAAATSVVAFFAVRLALGYALAGNAGLDLVGREYSSIAAAAQEGPPLTAIVSATLRVLLGHVLALAIMFGVACAALIARLLAARSGDDASRPAPLHAFAFAVLACLVPVVAHFTAEIAGKGPYEAVNRLHMRYYDFALPLLAMIAAGEMRSSPRAGAWKAVLRGGAALLVAAIAAIGAWKLRVAYSPALVDSPGLRGISGDPRLFALFAGLGLLCVAGWAFKPRAGAAAHVYLFLPASALVAGWLLYVEVRADYGRKNAYDLAGAYAHSYLPGPARSGLLVTGSDHSGVLRALFHVDDANARSLHVPEGAPVQLAKVPADRRWLVVVGDHAIDPPRPPYVAPGAFALYRVGPWEIDFSSADIGDAVRSVHGLSVAEPFGRWSDADEVVLEFVQPLPRRFELTLAATAYGPNAGMPFEVQVERDSRPVTFGSAAANVTLTFETGGTARSMRIRVPRPTSPRMLGRGPDERRLGIALHKLTIRELPAT